MPTDTRKNPRQFRLPIKVPVADVVNGAGSTATTLVLAAADVQAADYYNGWNVMMTGGVCIGQTRKVVTFDATTLTVSPAWIGGPPGNGDAYLLYQTITSEALQIGCIAAGSSTVLVQLKDDLGAYTLDNWYNNLDLLVVGGTGYAGQPIKRRILDYTGSSRICRLYSALPVAPGNDTIVRIQGHLYFPVHSLDAIALTDTNAIRYSTMPGGIGMGAGMVQAGIDFASLQTSLNYMELGMDTTADEVLISRWE